VNGFSINSGVITTAVYSTPSRRRRRDLLHKTKLQEFLDWVRTQGYLVHDLTGKHPYEVARLEKDGLLIHIYRRERGDHLTLTGEGVSLVLRWLATR
jgi:hypothetical protein